MKKVFLYGIPILIGGLYITDNLTYVEGVLRGGRVFVAGGKIAFKYYMVIYTYYLLYN